MATLEEKQIAKEIIIEMLKKDCLLRKEYPNTATVTDMVCNAYKTILDAISESAKPTKAYPDNDIRANI